MEWTTNAGYRSLTDSLSHGSHCPRQANASGKVASHPMLPTIAANIASAITAPVMLAQSWKARPKPVAGSGCLMTVAPAPGATRPSHAGGFALADAESEARRIFA
jgi:hypothetical protein